MMALHQKQSGFSLKILLDGLTGQNNIPDLYVNGICNDSRSIIDGDLFMAYRGHSHNGVDYIQSAVDAGAVAILVNSEDLINKIDFGVIPLIPVVNLNENLGNIAARFYNSPTNILNVVGITGTNGKTSVTYFIAQALEYLDKKCGVIGTLGHGFIGNLQSSANTTPDPLLLQEMFSRYVHDGTNLVAMEVSSQGLDQSRLSGTKFHIAVLTNLTEDHLDYHHNMDAYGSAKRKLFESNDLKYAVINVDDEFGNTLIDELGSCINIFPYQIVDDFRDELIEGVSGKLLENNLGNLSIEVNSPWGNGVVTTSLYGKFNAYNILAALTSLCLLDIPFEKVVDSLSCITGVPGRMELCQVQGSPTVIVDYAHTPDALKNVLQELRIIANQKLICVFGCGGDRDVHKRPMMGRVAETYADEVIVTNDNPRFESYENIITGILSGVDDKSTILIEPDRTEAISKAIKNASTEDIILVAGKGHETYQEIEGKRYPFNDIQLIRNLLGDKS